MSFGRSHFFPEDIPDIHNILISGVPNNGLLSLVAREALFEGLRPGGGFIRLSATLYWSLSKMPTAKSSVDIKAGWRLAKLNMITPPMMPNLCNDECVHSATTIWPIV